MELPLFSTINLVYVLEINIFERYYSNLKVVKFIVENRQKIWCNFMHLEKSLVGLQVRVIKRYYMDTSIQKLLKIRKIIFWRNTHIQVEKQSNQDGNTLLHLKNNGPHIKVPLILCFLIMTFNLCFYHQMRVKRVSIHIRNSFGHIRHTHHDYQNFYWC